MVVQTAEHFAVLADSSSARASINRAEKLAAVYRILDRSRSESCCEELESLAVQGCMFFQQLAYGADEKLLTASAPANH